MMTGWCSVPSSTLDAHHIRPDIVFSPAHVAVFIDGCYLHGCPVHYRTPKRNLDYWVPKLERNVERDRRADTALAARRLAGHQSVGQRGR
jgi:DNA mismatch endonuclease (patch repair protein)